MVPQWQDELEATLGLAFTVLDLENVVGFRRSRGKKQQKRSARKSADGSGTALNGRLAANPLGGKRRLQSS